MALLQSFIIRKTTILKVSLIIVLVRVLLTYQYHSGIELNVGDTKLTQINLHRREINSSVEHESPKHIEKDIPVEPPPKDNHFVVAEPSRPRGESSSNTTKSPTESKKRITASSIVRNQKSNSKEGDGRNVLEAIIKSVDDKIQQHEQPKGQEAKPAPGEMGKAVIINATSLSPEERKKYDEGWKRYQFNLYASDMISLHRSLQDKRHPQCRTVTYPDQLPDTSVIIIFYNEAWSVLLRTVHSVLDRSPRHLLKEIILVDDFSDFDYLHQPLQDYVDGLEKVRLLRSESRLGLIHARNMGASAATAEVLTFLDSHCEVSNGWLEPLLWRIGQNETNVVVPVINNIAAKTFEYQVSSGTPHTGGFNWNLIFLWFSRKHEGSPVEPISSPTMAGGLFSISRAFFEKLGRYDPGMLIWGGENLELSFKSWMCGGRLETMPCSHVGHVFREKSPYSWNIGVKNVLQRNLVRLAEVWLDDYKKYYFSRINFNNSDNGDVSDRIALRESLHCKSFDWYIKNIYPEVFIPGEALRNGVIRNQLSSRCIISDMSEKLRMRPCNENDFSQVWLMSLKGEVRTNDGKEKCLDLNIALTLYPCHGGASQAWEHTSEGAIRHKNANVCLEEVVTTKTLVTKPCADKAAQRWIWQRNIPDSQKHMMDNKLLPDTSDQ